MDHWCAGTSPLTATAAACRTRGSASESAAQGGQRRQRLGPHGAECLDDRQPHFSGAGLQFREQGRQRLPGVRAITPQGANGGQTHVRIRIGQQPRQLVDRRILLHWSDLSEGACGGPANKPVRIAQRFHQRGRGRCRRSSQHFQNVDGPQPAAHVLVRQPLDQCRDGRRLAGRGRFDIRGLGDGRVAWLWVRVREQRAEFRRKEAALGEDGDESALCRGQLFEGAVSLESDVRVRIPERRHQHRTCFLKGKDQRQQLVRLAGQPSAVAARLRDRACQLAIDHQPAQHGRSFAEGHDAQAPDPGVGIAQPAQGHRHHGAAQFHRAMGCCFHPRAGAAEREHSVHGLHQTGQSAGAVEPLRHLAGIQQAGEGGNGHVGVGVDFRQSGGGGAANGGVLVTGQRHQVRSKAVGQALFRVQVAERDTDFTQPMDGPNQARDVAVVEHGPQRLLESSGHRGTLAPIDGGQLRVRVLVTPFVEGQRPTQVAEGVQGLDVLRQAALS